MKPTIDQTSLEALAEQAWTARNNARLHGKTAVGAAVLTDHGQMYSGCNVEHRFRSHDIHAETNALSSMVTNDPQGIAVIIVIAAMRDNFTPCGGCLDWIFELGGPFTVVGFQGRVNGPILRYLASALMPHYPS